MPVQLRLFRINDFQGIYHENRCDEGVFTPQWNWMLCAYITFDYLSNVGRAGLVCQMAQNAENRETGQQTGERVQRRNNGRITVYIVLKAIERRVHNQVAKAHGQREKALRDGRIPNLCANARRTMHQMSINQN